MYFIISHFSQMHTFKSIESIHHGSIKKKEKNFLKWQYNDCVNNHTAFFVNIIYIVFFTKITTKFIDEALFLTQPATVKTYHLFVCLLFLPIVSKKMNTC